MGKGFFDSLLGKTDTEPFVSIDIGTSAIKVMTLDTSGEQPKLLRAGLVATPANAINNNAITKPGQIAESIRSILESNEIQETRATLCIPGPAVFTKKITISQTDLKELDSNIKFEASNYIPHSIDAVHLDYQVISNNGSTMDILLVAVKNEIVSSYVAAIEQAGLIPSIADVDYFALENMFALNYEDEAARTIALINIGARYSSVSIMHKGQALFTGDVGVGGRLYTDALVETLDMEPVQAEQLKMGGAIDGFDENVVHETLDRTTEHIASELHRQLGFFWNAAATENSIEAVYLCGGASQSTGLLEELGSRTGLECKLAEPFREVEGAENFDEDFLDEMKSAMSVSVGLAARRFADKEHAKKRVD